MARTRRSEKGLTRRSAAECRSRAQLHAQRRPAAHRAGRGGRRALPCRARYCRPTGGRGRAGRGPRGSRSGCARRARMRDLQAMEAALPRRPTRQISLTDPDARAMATNGKGTGLVGYNVQAAVDTKHHLIVAHEVTNLGHDRAQLASWRRQASEATGHGRADCAGRSGLLLGRGDPGLRARPVSPPLVPKPLTSGAKADGRFGKQDFIYEAEERRLSLPCRRDAATALHRVDETGMTLSRYWTTACARCAIKARCTPAKERRVTRWEHEACSMPCSAGLTRTQMPCGSGGRPSSTCSARSRPGWARRTS